MPGAGDGVIFKGAGADRTAAMQAAIVQRVPAAFMMEDPDGQIIDLDDLSPPFRDFSFQGRRSLFWSRSSRAIPSARS